LGGDLLAKVKYKGKECYVDTKLRCLFVCSNREKINVDKKVFAKIIRYIDVMGKLGYYEK